MAELVLAAVVVVVDVDLKLITRQTTSFKFDAHPFPFRKITSQFLFSLECFYKMMMRVKIFQTDALMYDVLVRYLVQR